MDPFQDIINSSVVIMLIKVSALACGSRSVKRHIALPRRLCLCIPHQCHPNNAHASWRGKPLCPSSCTGIASQPSVCFPGQTLNPRQKRWHLLQHIVNTSWLTLPCSVSTQDHMALGEKIQVLMIFSPHKAILPAYVAGGSG